MRWTPEEISLIGLAFAIGLMLLWILIVYLAARALRPRPVVPGPPTMELRPEPPAVVNLLVHGMRVTPAAALATLLDLAGRRYLEIFQPGPDPAQTLVRIARSDPAGLASLADFERKVLDRVQQLTGGQEYARMADLAERHAPGGFTWHRQFAAAVTEHAIRYRLAIGRTVGNTVGPLFVAFFAAGAVDLALYGALVPWTALARHQVVNPLVLGGLAIAAVVGWFGIFGVLFACAALWLPRGSLTPDGRRAAAHWLGVQEWLRRDEQFRTLPPAAVTMWDRYLGYGVALDAAPGATVGLDLDVGRTDAAWVDRGGQRRQVGIRYHRVTLGFGIPARIRLTWALFVLLYWLGGAALLGSYLAGLGAVAYALAVVAVLQVGRAGYRAVRALGDLTAPVTVTGPVLVVTPANTTGSPGSRYRLVVDDGHSDPLPGWVIGEKLAERCRPGVPVRMTAERWTRCVRDITILGAHLPVAAAGQQPSVR